MHQMLQTTTELIHERAKRLTQSTVFLHNETWIQNEREKGNPECRLS